MLKMPIETCMGTAYYFHEIIFMLVLSFALGLGFRHMFTRGDKNG